MPPLPPLRFAPEPERKYFGKVADATPEDTMLLTLGCGKFRFFDHQYGDIPNTSLPRLVSRQELSAVCVLSCIIAEGPLPLLTFPRLNTH